MHTFLLDTKQSKTKKPYYMRIDRNEGVLANAENFKQHSLIYTARLSKLTLGIGIYVQYIKQHCIKKRRKKTTKNLICSKLII